MISKICWILALMKVGDSAYDLEICHICASPEAKLPHVHSNNSFVFNIVSSTWNPIFCFPYFSQYPLLSFAAASAAHVYQLANILLHILGVRKLKITLD